MDRKRQRIRVNHSGNGSEHDERDVTPESSSEAAAASGGPGESVGPGIDPQLESDIGAELEEAREELERLSREASENLELAKRKQAEFENYRRRVEREQSEKALRASERVVVELMPAIDNLERAIAHAAEHETGGIADAGGTGGTGEAARGEGELLRGVRMVHEQILEVLAREGVELEDPAGEPFDPERHQAVMQREDPEAAEGAVLEVLNKGYVMHDRVLRPATVVIAAAGSGPGIGEGAEER